MIIPEPEPDPWWKFARNVVVGVAAVAVVVGAIVVIGVLTGGVGLVALASIVGACALGGTVIVSNTLQDIKSGQARGLGEMFLQTVQGSVTGAVTFGFGAYMAPMLATSALATGVFSVWSGMMTRNAFAFADKNIDTKEEHWGYVYDPKWIALDIITAGAARLLFNRLAYGKANPSAADLDGHNGPRSLSPRGKKPATKTPPAGKNPGKGAPSGKNGAGGKPKSGADNKAGTTGGKGAGKYDKYVKEATQDSKRRKVVLGKYNQDGVSYVDIAKREKATYFQLDKWDDVTKIVGEENMWKINEQFLQEQLSQGKTFIFSHNPNTPTGYFAQKVDFLKRHGYSFIPEGDIWKAIK